MKWVIWPLLAIIVIDIAVTLITQSPLPVWMSIASPVLGFLFLVTAFLTDLLAPTRKMKDK